MKIEILSETITNEDLIEQLNLENPEIEFNLVELPKDTRPLDPNIIMVVQSVGIGSIIVALITGITNIKLKKMELEDKKEDRRIEEKKLEFNKEIELAKIQAEKEKIVLQGYIQIIAKHNENLIKEGKETEVLQLLQMGLEINNKKISIPINLNTEIIESKVSDIIEPSNVKRIIHNQNKK